MKFFSNKYFKDKEEEQDFFISIIVILFFGVGIFFFALPAITEINDEVVQEVIDKAPSLTSKKPSLDNKGAVNIEEYVAELKEKEIDNTTVLPTKDSEKEVAPLIESKHEEEVVESFDEVIEPEPEPVVAAPVVDKKANVLPSIKEAETVVEEATKAIEESAVSTLNEEPIVEKPIVAKKPKANFDCKIMIGAFKNSLNAEMLKQRLSDDGYEIFAETRGKFNLIGIKASCQPIELENALLIMRSNYSADAFVVLDE